MSDFLLEILNEEIPASMQKDAATNFSKIASEVFAKNNLKLESDQVKVFITPRRITLYLYRLSENQEVPALKKIGPKTSANDKAVEGFLRSVGLSNKSELSIIENKGSDCYLFEKPASETKTVEIIQSSLPQIMQKMVQFWPKLMRWDIEGTKDQPSWIRPIRNIACLFGSELVDFEFAGIKANKLTYGHFLKNNSPLEITNAAHYEELLKDNFVILDQDKRKQKIISGIRQITHDNSLQTIDEEDSKLVDEVCGLCEWPEVLLASIDERFLELPDEVLILTLKLNQKYFCLKNSTGSLVPKFIFVSNAVSDSTDKIIADNEKLVRARLSDSEFFINEDLKVPLEKRLEDLKKVVFHQKLGSVYDKITRMETLSKFLSFFVPSCELNLSTRAADLCKVDLTTKAVAELPELQGKIGSFYAFKQGEDSKIAAAIYEHYLPLGPNSELPKTALGIVLSIADKIDSIVGFFLADEKPTSSKDPYALRRAALGIIRIGFQYNIAFPVRILVEKSINAYPIKTAKSLLSQKDKKFFDSKKIIVEEVIKFFVERLKVYLKENENVKSEIINAVIEDYLSDLDGHKYCDVLYLAKKIKFLDQFISDSKYRNILSLYKRASNILEKEEKKDGRKYEGSPSRLLLKTEYEKKLLKEIKQLSTKHKKLVNAGEFAEGFKILEVLEQPLESFFDNVIVNDEDPKMRENHLLLLSKIRTLFNRVSGLSRIEII